MASLTPEQRRGEIAAIRAKLKSNKAAYTALSQAIVKTLAGHNIVVDESLASELIIALPEEVSDNLNAVILPGGTNCA